MSDEFINTKIKNDYTKLISSSTTKQYNIDDFINKRIENYHKFQEEFTVSPDCLIKDIKNINLNYVSYSILETATPSASALIFQISDNLIIKIKYYFNRSNDKEIEVLNILTNLSINKECPHFPIIYNYLECNEESKKYSAIITEKADGDFNNFFKEKYNDYELIKNAIEQIIMSIYFFNNLTGYYHNDCHFGNFLYFKIKKGGYLKYEINGEKYNIKNLGYLWIIWDFDRSSLNSSSKIKTTDIKRFILLLNNYYINGYRYLSSSISKYFQPFDKVKYLILINNIIDIYNDYDNLFSNIKKINLLNYIPPP